MGKLIRAFDWSKTELGPIESWAAALKTATNIVLQTPLPLVMLWGPNGIMIYNDAYSGFAGKRHPSLLGSKVLEGWAEVADFNRKVLEVGLAGGTLSFKDQKLTLFRNNVPEQVWMDLNYGPVFGEDNKPAGVLAIVVETTDRVKAEEHLRLVINELNHRVKNTLAMTQAIAAQTFRKSEDFEAAHLNFSARIKALADASDLLTGERWVGVSLRQITANVLRPYHADTPNRRIIRGPDVQLTPKSAISLSMALHELATNATKYGAWSGADGTVAIEWNVAGDGNMERLSFEWRESGGPPVAQPSRKGFGSRLVERGLAAELGGTTYLDFRPGGVVFRIDAPLNPYLDGER